MNSIGFSAFSLIEAPASVVYAIIADYHHGHPDILPKPPFTGLEVEEGGIGDGTVIRVGMKILGKHQEFRSVVTEPDPGRILVKTNDNGYVTRFTVESQAGGQNAYVTISTEINGRNGLLGSLEYWIVKRLLQPVYTRELEQLAELAMK